MSNEMPADLYNRLMNHMMEDGSRTGLMLANEIKDLYGASAQRRAAAAAVEPEPEIFGLVTRWVAPGKKPIVHIWGPYTSKEDATSGRLKVLRRHLKDYPNSDEGEFTVNACAMKFRLDDPPRYAQLEKK